MEKAYDVKELVEIVKSKGLDIAEEGAKVAAISVLEWLEKSAIASPNPYDNLLAPFYPIARQKVLEQIDKIDGQVG